MSTSKKYIYEVDVVKASCLGRDTELRLFLKDWQRVRGLAAKKRLVHYFSENGTTEDIKHLLELILPDKKHHVKLLNSLVDGAGFSQNIDNLNLVIQHVKQVDILLFFDIFSRFNRVKTIQAFLPFVSQSAILKALTTAALREDSLVNDKAEPKKMIECLFNALNDKSSLRTWLSQQTNLRVFPYLEKRLLIEETKTILTENTKTLGAPKSSRKF